MLKHHRHQIEQHRQQRQQHSNNNTSFHHSFPMCTATATTTATPPPSCRNTNRDVFSLLHNSVSILHKSQGRQDYCEPLRHPEQRCDMGSFKKIFGNFRALYRLNLNETLTNKVRTAPLVKPHRFI
jgi:hypothetical protein